MSETYVTSWSRLEAEPPHGQELTARLFVPDRSDSLFAAIDAEGLRHFLVRLDEGIEGVDDRESKGVVVETRELRLEGASLRRYIDLRCIDERGGDAFDIVGRDLAAAMSQETLQPAAIVRQVLAKWRRFWGAPHRSVLSKEQQVGLFGELWFLTHWLLPPLGEHAVEWWTGPIARRHDFQGRQTAVEVKSTLASKHRIHRVHGLSQLTKPERGELFLLSLRLREEPGANNTLPQLVSMCRNVLGLSDAANDLFEARLAAAGYADVYAEEYAAVRLQVVDELLFHVCGSFPRLTEDLIGGVIPDGVGYVEYEINLSGMEGAAIARGPGSSTWMNRG